MAKSRFLAGYVTGIQKWICRLYLRILKAISYEKYIKVRRNRLKKHNEQLGIHYTELQRRLMIVGADAVQSIARFSEAARKCYGRNNAG